MQESLFKKISILFHRSENEVRNVGGFRDQVQLQEICMEQSLVSAIKSISRTKPYLVVNRLVLNLRGTLLRRGVCSRTYLPLDYKLNG